MSSKNTSSTIWQYSGRRTVLSAEEESELAELVMTMANVGFPLTRSEIQHLAFEYAKSHGINSFSDNKQATKYKYRNGLTSTRKPSTAWVLGMCLRTCGILTKPVCRMLLSQHR